jgi:hypothetical protein
VTAEIGFDHSHGHDLEFGILVNGLITTGYSNVGNFDQSTSVSEIFDLGVGSEVSVGIACPDLHSSAVNVKTIKVRIERL